MKNSGKRGALADYLLTDLYTYMSETSGMKLYRQPHWEMCQYLESLLPPPPPYDNAELGQTKGCIAAPRETLKTSAAQALIEYFVLKWKRKYGYDVRVLLLRSNREAAKQVLGSIRENLSTNPVILEAFGELRPDGDSQLPWSSDAITLNWRTTPYREPTIATGGIESPQTGMHVDLVLADDLANETNYTSERDMVRARIKLESLDPIVNRWGSTILVGTRWGHNDPIAYVIDLNAKFEEEELRKYPDDPAKREKPPWKTLIRGVYLEDGSLYYPAHLSEKVINQKRRSLDTKLFTAWYLNQVVADGSKVFRDEYLRFYDGEYEPDDLDYATLAVTEGALGRSQFSVRATIHVDPAATVGAGANFSAFAVVLTDAQERYFIHETWKGKETPSQLIARIVATAAMYQPAAISIDVLGQQVLWLDPLKKALRAAGLTTIVIPYKGRTHDEKVGKGILGKAKRIEALEPLFRDGRIFVRRGANAPLLHEYKFYDGPTHHNHYDLLDALAHLRTMTRKPDAQRFYDEQEAIELAELEDASETPMRRKVPGTRAGMFSH